MLQDFLDKEERTLCILSQEKRTKDRDGYHDKIFVKRADTEANVNGLPAYFVTGDTGERRLFWLQPETALILSSTVLTDSEMIQVAGKVAQ